MITSTILIEKNTKRYYAGFDSNTGSPVFLKTRESAVELTEQDAQTVIRQLKLLGVDVLPEE